MPAPYTPGWVSLCNAGDGEGTLVQSCKCLEYVGGEIVWGTSGFQKLLSGDKKTVKSCRELKELEVKARRLAGVVGLEWAGYIASERQQTLRGVAVSAYNRQQIGISTAGLLVLLLGCVVFRHKKQSRRAAGVLSSFLQRVWVPNEDFDVAQAWSEVLGACSPLCFEEVLDNACTHLRRFCFDSDAAAHDQVGVLLAHLGLFCEACDACACALRSLLPRVAQHIDGHIGDVSMDREPPQHVLHHRKRKVCDEDYQRRLMENVVAKRQAANASTHAKDDNTSGNTCKSWQLKWLSGRFRAARREFAAWGSTSHATHVAQDATRLGKPAKETMYSLLVKVRGDRRSNFLGPPQASTGS